MAKNKLAAASNKPARQPSKAPPAAKAAPEKGKHSSSHVIRETIEQIVFAFVLAFLFRTFEAEAFVIPTGSMAPTLQGRHRDVECPKCHYVYRTSASSEVDDETHGRGPLSPDELKAKEIVEITCPMCRYSMNVDPSTEQGAVNPAYNGDRILVSKFPYDFGDPRRWDVVVFKYPGDAKINYIKRLVGLPGEKIKIAAGDIWTRAPGRPEYQIARKPPAKLRAMLQLVHDNNYVPEEMTAAGWPSRWQAWPMKGDRPAPWESKDGGRSFQLQAPTQDTAWLRYQHFVPTADDWNELEHGGIPAGERVAPVLITDFYAYNSFGPRDRGVDAASFGLNWVGDLMIEGDVDAKTSSGQLLLDLVKGGKHFRCTIDLATGQEQLAIDGLANFAPKASTSVKGSGKHRLAFANVDHELTLWVDDEVVEFDGPTTYHALGNDYPEATQKNMMGDLAPAGFGARGADLAVSNMRIWRDIYYIADKYEGYSQRGISEYNDPDSSIAQMSRKPTPKELADFWSTPSEWQSLRPGQENARREVTFPLGTDQFFVLGDNSPQSKDARLWEREQFVSRKLLTGKAVFIYWPHSKGKIPYLNIPFPFFPNFASMGFVR